MTKEEIMGKAQEECACLFHKDEFLGHGCKYCKYQPDNQICFYCSPKTCYNCREWLDNCTKYIRERCDEKEYCKNLSSAVRINALRDILNSPKFIEEINLRPH